MRDLNVGIVGLGWVAGAHIETFKKLAGVNVVAVCSRRENAAPDLERRLGIPLKVYRDYEAMLRDPGIDIIDICTPHPFHPSHAIAAAEAGKHLIIEKPISLAYDEARAVGRAIRGAGVRACVCFELRFSSQAAAICSVLEQGLIGQVDHFNMD